MITQTVANSAGVPEGYAKYTLVAEYNDEKSVKQLFDAYKGQIAAIIVEPVAANMGVVPPKAGFLEFLRDITQTDGALLIFDEVITGIFPYQAGSDNAWQDRRWRYAGWNLRRQTRDHAVRGTTWRGISGRNPVR